MSFFNRLFRCFSSSASSSPAQIAAAKDLVESTIQENKVVVFSKSYCPYCHSTKSLFSSNFPDVPVKVYELNQLDEGSDIQAYLLEKTGQRTVPNVFINQKHVGGNDDTRALFKGGELTQLLNLKA